MIIQDRAPTFYIQRGSARGLAQLVLGLEDDLTGVLGVDGADEQNDRVAVLDDTESRRWRHFQTVHVPGELGRRIRAHDAFESATVTRTDIIPF